MSARAAFAYGAPIGALGGLIGLGGAEFRLPVLKAAFGYEAKRAVAANLAVSCITVIAALAIRSAATPWQSLWALWPPIVGLTGGAVVGARAGASFASRLSHERFERLILVLLVAIGALLIGEAFLPLRPGGLSLGLLGSIVAGAAIGSGIGVVSSLLGVAGGELLIPTFVLVFGADMKVAGTASLCVSLPTLFVGLRQYQTVLDRRDLEGLIVPMGFGSILGAFVGALAMPLVPSNALKVVLGVILMISAARIFGKRTTTLRIATTTSAVDSGLLPPLLTRFAARHGCRTHLSSVGSGRAFELLASGEADVALTHSPEREQAALRDAVAKSITPFMQNRFVLVGPKEAATELVGARRASEVMKRVAESGRAFVSRSDESGTHDRERALWAQIGAKPERIASSQGGMAATLRLASTERAFTLSDHATYAALANELDLEVLFDDQQELGNVYSLALSSRATPRMENLVAALGVFLCSSLSVGERAVVDPGADEIGLLGRE